MAILRSLLVTVGMKDDDFRKGVKKFKSDVASMGSDLANIAKQATIAGAAIGAAAAAGLAALTKSSMDAIDTTVKLADRLGVSTEFLTGIQHAADLSGVSMEELRTGLEFFMKTLPQGSDVGSEFNKIAKEIAAIEDPVARAQMAMKNFGKLGGQRIIPLLTSDLQAAQAEAEALGLTFSRGEGSLVERANDAISKVKKVFVGLGNTIAIQLAPFIEAAADKFREFTDNGKSMRDLVGPAIEYVGKAVAWLADLVSLAQEGWYNLKGAALEALSTMLKVITRAMHAANNLAWATGGEDVFKINDIIHLERAAQDFGESATKAFRDAKTAYGEFLNGTKSQQVTQAFGEIKRQAEQHVKDVNEAMKKTVENLDIPNPYGPDTGMISGGPNGPLGPDIPQNMQDIFTHQMPDVRTAQQAFSQVDLSRTAIGGVDFARKVANDQLKVQHEIKQGIDRTNNLLEGGLTARAG